MSWILSWLKMPALLKHLSRKKLIKCVLWSY